MKYSHPLTYMAAFAWPVLAAAISLGQVSTTQPGVAPNVSTGGNVAAAPAVASPAPAPANVRVAVLPFVSTNPQAANAWIGKSIQQSLSADMLQSAPSRVQTADTAATTSAQAADVGRQLGVNFVVFGTYSSTDAALRIVGEVIDVSTSSATTSLKATGKLGDVFVLEDSLSRQARTIIFGPAAASEIGPGYTVHELPAAADNGQTYYPPNGTPTYVSSSTGYANPAQQNYDQQYQQAYISTPNAGAYYSYPYYSYPAYNYSYYSSPYYGYPYLFYPGISFGFGFHNGFHNHFGGHGFGGHGFGGHGFGGGHGFSGGGHVGGGGHGGGGHR